MRAEAGGRGRTPRRQPLDAIPALRVGPDQCQSAIGRDALERVQAAASGTPVATGAPAYLMPMAMESGPTSASTRVDEKPASFIQPVQSAPV